LKKKKKTKWYQQTQEQWHKTIHAKSRIQSVTSQCRNFLHNAATSQAPNNHTGMNHTQCTLIRTYVETLTHAATKKHDCLTFWNCRHVPWSNVILLSYIIVIVD
jgi:hypothetical protein